MGRLFLLLIYMYRTLSSLDSLHKNLGTLMALLEKGKKDI